MNINRCTAIRIFLIFIYFSFSALALIAVSSGGAPAPSPTISQSDTIQDLQNQVRNLQSLTDYYKNETNYCKNLYENESANVSNKNIIDVKNNINAINYNITQIYNDIKNIENNLVINFYMEIIIEITLIGSLITIYYKYIRKSK